jgi:hypothetical protein
MWGSGGKGLWDGYGKRGKRGKRGYGNILHCLKRFLCWKRRIFVSSLDWIGLDEKRILLKVGNRIIRGKGNIFTILANIFLF